MTERLTPLTEPDRQILVKQRNRNLILAVLGAAGSIASLALLIPFRTLYFLIAAPLGCLLLAFAALGSFLNFLKLEKDLRQGQKLVITAPIEDQNVDVTRGKGEYGGEGSASYTFWVKARGRKLTVSETQYYDFKKGDEVEAQVAPHSGTLFSITKRGDW